MRAAVAAVAVLGAGSGAMLLADEPVRVEPAFAVLPANHLKFYLYFPGPMERGEVFRHLRLVEVDVSGAELAEVPEPFREVELWDETFTRLTLWFHPGRQKPGVNLNLEIGPVLEEGKRYRLEISGKWRLEAGEALGETVRHSFAAGPFDGTQPDPRRWKVEGERPLVVRSDDLLDPVSLRHSLTLIDERGEEMAGAMIGELTLCSDRPPGLATGLVFAASETLPPGSYRLRIDPRLEDLAGNSVARPFNVDLGQSRESEGKEAGLFLLPLTVPPPDR